MIPSEKLDVQYIPDEKGEKRAVILPIEQYHELLEDLADLAALAECRDEPTIAHADLINELKLDGFLPKATGVVSVYPVSHL